MQYLANFMLSEGAEYQNLEPAHEDLYPQKSANSSLRSLDGWSYMMRNEERDMALVYFENKAELPTVKGFDPDSAYLFMWFDPKKGEWQAPIEIRSDKTGVIQLPKFPSGKNRSGTDWAAKITNRK
jgi:hypothetical protein